MDGIDFKTMTFSHSVLWLLKRKDTSSRDVESVEGVHKQQGERFTGMNVSILLLQPHHKHLALSVTEAAL